MKPNDDLINDSDAVNEHIKKYDAELKIIVNELRKIILATNKKIGERVKWNNPSFFYLSEMKPFNPKEYKREIIVFNLHKGRIMLVFPSGAKINDQSGLLTGDYKDGRRLIIFEDLKDVKSKAKQLQNVIKTWLSLVD